MDTTPEATAQQMVAVARKVWIGDFAACRRAGGSRCQAGGSPECPRAQEALRKGCCCPTEAALVSVRPVYGVEGIRAQAPDGRGEIATSAADMHRKVAAHWAPVSCAPDVAQSDVDGLSDVWMPRRRYRWPPRESAKSLARSRMGDAAPRP